MFRSALNTFGDDTEIIDHRHVYDRSQQCILLFIRQYLLRQRTVYLDDVHRKIRQIIQAAVPYPKIIQRYMNARLPQLLQRFSRVVNRLDQDALGYLQRNTARLNIGSADKLQQMLRAVSDQKLLHRKIDPHALHRKIDPHSRIKEQALAST